MNKIFPAFALIIALLPLQSAAQKKNVAPTRTRASAPATKKVEPLRTASGLMRDNRISIRQSDWINDGAPLFDYTLTGARIVGGRLEFTGSLEEPGKTKTVVRVMLVSTSARSANPWPNASAPTARDRRPAAGRERGEVSEQTQSLYSAAEAGSGCELIYLKLTPPGQTNAIQVGVVLAHQDNARGQAINHALCRVVRAMTTKGNPSEALAQLNRAISKE
jgi:hypothetical protein